MLAEIGKSPAVQRQANRESTQIIPLYTCPSSGGGRKSSPSGMPQPCRSPVRYGVSQGVDPSLSTRKSSIERRINGIWRRET